MTPRTNDPDIPETALQPSETTTTSEPQPTSGEHDDSSTPSTDTLPSTSTSCTTDQSTAHQTVRSGLQKSAGSPPETHSNDIPLPPPATPGTVGAVGPPPDSGVLDPERVATCPEPLLRRIEILSTYSNSEANTFALGRIPPSATWGITDPYDDRSKILCNPNTNEPVNIWILGHITNTWFMKDGSPNSQCSITILPLSTKIGQYANVLLSEFSNPTLPSTALNEYDRGLIRAVRWQRPKGGGVSTLFNSIFDARQILKSKSSMTKLDISHLEKRALVLLETHFNRYRQKDENGQWTISKTQFELQAVYLLQEPCLPEAEPNADSGVEIAGLAI